MGFSLKYPTESAEEGGCWDIDEIGKILTAVETG